MPEPIETKPPKIETEPPQDLVAAQFADLGVDIKNDYPQIYERLLELNGGKESHFHDAVKMAEIIDRLWDKLELENIHKDGEEKITKEKMKLCALLHDVGKSGPRDARIEERRIIQLLFAQKTFKDSRGKSIRDALKAEGIEEREDMQKLLKEAGMSLEGVLMTLGMDLDKNKMIDFWQKHVDWTYDILKANQGGVIDERTIDIASSHHILDGKNPANLPLEKISDDVKTIELIDKYQILTLIDKYQAYRGRSAYSHEEAIVALKDNVNKSILPAEAKKDYLRFIEKTLEKSEEELKQIIEENHD
jgi:hypothetical protein